MIVIIAVMGIFLGIITASPMLMDGNRVKACADEIVSVMEKVRMATLGKDEVKLKLSKEPEKPAKVLITTKVAGRAPEEETFNLSGEKVDIYYSKDGVNEIILGADGIEIEFNRSSGALVSDIRTITVRKGTRSRVIRIYKETGKVVTE